MEDFKKLIVFDHFKLATIPIFIGITHICGGGGWGLARKCTLSDATQPNIFLFLITIYYFNNAGNTQSTYL